MWEQGGCENSTGMPTPAKTTLNVLYRLTTEMWEQGGWENSTGMPTLAKTTLNVLYRLTTEMGEERGENSASQHARHTSTTTQMNHKNVLILFYMS